MGPNIAPHIMWLINNCIQKGVVPDILKVSRILPISKPGKDLTYIESYRPINNLPIIEKMLETHVLKHFNTFLEKNKIINKNHHGGRKRHSTTTAMTAINNKLLQNFENNKISVVLCTDLSAAFDTVDSEILFKKLEHYGVRNMELNFFKSYLSNRKQYVELETFKSDVVNCLPCSCVQGSKFSGTLYTLYTNEVPLLYKLMYSDTFKNLTNLKKQNFKNIDHLTINFVDDSSSVIAFINHVYIKQYLNNYYTLIHEFYNVNKLKINPDKTLLMLIYKPKFKNNLKNFFFNAGQFIIKPKSSIKILGYTLREDLKPDTHIGTMCATLHNKLFELKKCQNLQTCKCIYHG